MASCVGSDASYGAVVVFLYSSRNFFVSSSRSRGSDLRPIPADDDGESCHDDGRKKDQKRVHVSRNTSQNDLPHDESTCCTAGECFDTTGRDDKEEKDDEDEDEEDADEEESEGLMGSKSSVVSGSTRTSPPPYSSSSSSSKKSSLISRAVDSDGLKPFL